MRKVTLMLSLFIAGCTQSGFYKLNAVTNASLSPKGTHPRTLTYDLRMDSLYYSPGVLNIKNGATDCFKVIRCKEGKQCKVDIPSTVLNNQHQVPLDSSVSENICLEGPNSKPVELSPSEP